MDLSQEVKVAVEIVHFSGGMDKFVLGLVLINGKVEHAGGTAEVTDETCSSVA